MRRFDSVLVGPVERLLYLKTVPLFQGMPASELAVFAEYVTEHRFRRGRRLLSEGEPVDCFYVLVRGRVVMGRGGEPIRTYGEGDSVGVIPLLAGDPDGVEVRALTDVLALRIDGGTCWEVFEDRFSIYVHVLQTLCRLLRSERRKLSPRRSRARAIAPRIDRPELVSHLLALREAVPFTGASFAGLAQLAACVVPIEVGAGTELWTESSPSGQALLLVSGRIDCAAGGERFERGPGYTFGFVDSVAEQERSYSARAGTDLTALSIDRETLLDVFEDHPHLAEACLRHIASRVLSLFERRAESGPLVPDGLRTSTVPGIG